MKEKRNIHELIVKEEPHLHEILDPAQVTKFKELTNELETLGQRNKCLELKQKWNFLF